MSTHTRLKTEHGLEIKIENKLFFDNNKIIYDFGFFCLFGVFFGFFFGGGSFFGCCFFLFRFFVIFHYLNTS